MQDKYLEHLNEQIEALQGRYEAAMGTGYNAEMAIGIVAHLEKARTSYLQSLPKWELVSNEPQRGKRVWATNGTLVSEAAYHGDFWTSRRGGFLTFTPTHYLPITTPDLPNEFNTNL
jgi:hypothetical protein